MNLLEVYLNEKRLSLSPKTIKSYKSVLGSWQKYLASMGKSIEQADRVEVTAEE